MPLIKRCRGAPLGAAALLLAACAEGEPDSRDEFATFEQRLVIEVEAASVAVPLEAMDVWLSPGASRPEPFLIHGDGVAIAGTLPSDVRVGYEENWRILIGRSIAISSRGGSPRYAEPSIMTVPGGGQYRVIGGTITFERVGPGAGAGGETPLTGRIELLVRAPGGARSVKGTIAVKAMTWG